MKKNIRLLFAISLSLPGLSLSVCTSGAELAAIRVGHQDEKTRLVFDLSAPVSYSVEVSSQPHILLVKMADTQLTASRPMPPFLSPIEDIQALSVNDSELLVTVDLSEAAKAKYFFLPPEQSRGNRLVVDLYQAESAGAVEAGKVSENAAAAQVAMGVAGQSNSSTETASVSSRGSMKPVSEDTRYEFSGTWEQEWGYQTKDTGNQKFEALIEPRLDIDLSNGSNIVAIGRIRLDAVGDLGPDVDRPDNYSDINGPLYNDEYAELSLRELYLDTEWKNVQLRIGKQQIVWGQADGIKVLDVVNPQSFREFILDDFDDSRIPLWTVNAELPLGEGSLQLLWIPDTTYHELAEEGTPYFLTSPKWVPTIPTGDSFKVESPDKPNNALEDSDAGARYTLFFKGWDISLNYLYHYQDYPVLYQQLVEGAAGDVLQIMPDYKRNHLFGTTLSNAFDAFTLRAEFAYNTDTYHTSDSLEQRGIEESSEFASVVGLDWQASSDTLLSAQWFLSYLPDYSSDIVRDESENTISMLYQQSFANEAWQLRLLALYSVEDEDSLYQVKLKYWLDSNLEVWLGSDFFDGTQRGTFGQFDKEDRLLIGFEYGF